MWIDNKKRWKKGRGDNVTRKPVEVLVVDDSAVVRGLMVKSLESSPKITVVGTAMHGERALQFLRKQPADVVLLDVEMPVMDGLTALQHILKEFPKTHVIMVSSMTYDGASTTVQALKLGAADCVAKPNAGSASQSIEQLTSELVPLVIALGGNTSSTLSVAAPPPSKPVAAPFVAPDTKSQPRVVVIGASTGGPNALSTVIGGLSREFELPILITQHMPAMFTPMLAKHLAQDGGRPCMEATHGTPIEKGHTYVAPGDFHMEIDRKEGRLVTVLHQGPPEHFCRPSVNPLFRSAAKWYGFSTLAVMLTGMGEDGIEGTRELAAVKAQIIAQDEESSVVWGMPAAVCKAGLADQILPLDQIAPAVARICRGSAMAMKR